MTKEQLVYKIRKRLPDTIDWHENYIALDVAMAFNQIYYDAFRRDSSNLDLYCKTYIAAIKYDKSKDVYYSDIPVNSIVQFPDPAEGIRDIRRKKGSGIEFVPLRKKAILMYDDDEVAKLSKIIGYNIINNRIEYRWLKEELVDSDVIMDVVRTFDDIGWNEQVYIPSGQDEKFIRMVVEFLMGQPVKDNVNDDNPRTQ